MNVVTVSREFGTGGKAFGKALAEALGYTYLDKNFAHELAGKLDMNEQYIDYFLDTGAPVGMSSGTGGIAYSPEETQKNVILQIESQKLLKELASKENIVVIGRAADVILSEFHPLRIFVYADTASKVANYKSANDSMVHSTDQDVARALQMVDTERYQHHSLFSPIKWGEKIAYDICINATNVHLEKMAPIIADYARAYFGEI